MDEELKELLRQAIRGPGGMPGLLYELRDIAEEMHADARDILQNEREAAAWSKVARTLDRAAGQSTPLMRVL